MGLIPPTRGRISLNATSFPPRAHGDGAHRADGLPDPYASLNSRQTCATHLADPLRLHGVTDKAEVEQRVMDMTPGQRLRPDHADRYLHEFSGGQRQRIGIARALILKAQAGDLRRAGVGARRLDPRPDQSTCCSISGDEMGLACIMIVSHDLGVVEHVQRPVAVMYLGRIVEQNGLGRPRGPAPSLTRALRSRRSPTRSISLPSPPKPRPRRTAKCAQPAAGLPLQSALPDEGRPLCQRGVVASQPSPASSGGLSFPGSRVN